jgi:RimJ/RimL family protein N-acetyltransferase
MASGLEAPVMGVSSVYTLRDGTAVTLRELRDQDREMLEHFVDQLSEDTIYFRFLAAGINREVLIDQLSPRPGAFILVGVKDRTIVGHVAYFKSDLGAAEIGILISDAYQGKGLGTRLIESVARAANSDGVTMFEAIIDWNNTKMIKMVRGMGFPTSEKVEPDLIRIRFPTSIDPVTIEEFQEKWVFRPDVD